EERHAVALLKAQNAGGEIEEIAIGGLEQLVARQGFENMRERLAVMARRFEAAAGQHGRDLAAQQRNGACRAAIGLRGEEAEEEPHADGLAMLAQDLDADRVHMDGTVDDGAAARL